MTRCYICEKSDIMIPNSKVTYHGRKNGKKVQKTVRICNCCGAMMSDEEILEQVSECLGCAMHFIRTSAHIIKIWKISFLTGAVLDIPEQKQES